MSVLVFRGLLEDSEDLSAVREVETFRLLGSRCSTLRFFTREDPFDSAVLGHAGLSMPQGPLTVAALGWDPPERSTHFHLSLLSLEGDSVCAIEDRVSADDLRLVEAELAKLKTQSMTVLKGEGLDHALVWERRVDLLTHAPGFAFEHGYLASRPEGDQENDLRRLIDDSVNILGELEFNQRRMDSGLPPLNLAWPWGHGVRLPVDNLALRLGYPWQVRSASLSLRGYARLSGFRISPLPPLDSLHGKDVSRLVEDLKKEPHTLAELDFSPWQGEQHLEEKAYRLDVLGRTLVEPMLEFCRDREYPLWILATNREDNGVAAKVEFREHMRDHFPFDERSLSERNVPEINLSHLLANS